MRTGFRQFTGGLTTEVFVEAHHIENINMVSTFFEILIYFFLETLPSSYWIYGNLGFLHPIFQKAERFSWFPKLKKNLNVKKE